MSLTKEFVEDKCCMPWEVIELIGQERLEKLGENFPIKLITALEVLKNLHDSKGLKWMLANKVPLQNQLIGLEEM